jgi:hypothetical protein
MKAKKPTKSLRFPSFFAPNWSEKKVLIRFSSTLFGYSYEVRQPAELNHLLMKFERFSQFLIGTGKF